MALPPFGSVLKTAIHPIGDTSDIEGPLFLQTKGKPALHDRGKNELYLTVLRFREDRYEGLAKRNGTIPESFGRYTFAEEGQYDSYFSGQWRNARPCGPGVRSYANGSVFMGTFHSFKNGVAVPDGVGVCNFWNKDILAGDWKNGSVHGRGLQQSSEGGDNSYVGMYILGQRSNLGVYSFADGSEYSGQFEDDCPHGQGSYTSGSNSYLGQWKNGKREGRSVFSSHRGSRTWAGKWLAGELAWSTCIQIAGRKAAFDPKDQQDVQRCLLVARSAKAFSDRAVALAESLCDPDGDFQIDLEMARETARASGKEAESAARKARALEPQQWIEPSVQSQKSCRVAPQWSPQSSAAEPLPSLRTLLGATSSSNAESGCITPMSLKPYALHP